MERTTIPLDKETRKALAVEKDLRDSKTYDELLREILRETSFLAN